jgi:hypothetical protein
MLKSTCFVVGLAFCGIGMIAAVVDIEVQRQGYNFATNLNISGVKQTLVSGVLV